MTHRRPLADWLPGLATALSLLACYGWLLVVGLLGALGVALVTDEGLWAVTIVGLALVAVLAIGLGRDGRPWPLLLAAAGAAMLAWAMWGHYTRLTEAAGFALLLGGAVWDWRRRAAGRRRPTGR